jgi:HEPN domain-containing protein
MKRDMVQDWLASAHDDLRVMEELSGAKDLTHMVAFHAQQAIEKVLKAYLEFSGKNVPKVHKVATLLQLSGAECGLDAELVGQLDELYIESRYPGEMGLLPYGKPTLDDARRFEKAARETHRWMVDLLERENGEKR